MRNEIRIAFAAIAALAAPPARAGMTPRQIYQQDGPAVVLIMGFAADGNGEIGTGSIIDKEGHILTNAHVVYPHGADAPFDNIHVYLKPKRITGDPKKDLVDPKTARVAQSDRGLDLALLELQEKPENPPVLPIGDSDAIEAGEPVVAIGHPEQGGLWTLTKGVVSTVLADMGGVKGKDMFQTDASINRGNSGGPLINNAGALIGVNSSMSRKAADGIAITSVNFSLKSNVVKSWIASTGAKVDYVAGAQTEEAPEAEPAGGGKPAAAKPAEAPKSAEAQAPAASTPKTPAEAEKPARPAETPKPAEPKEPAVAQPAQEQQPPEAQKPAEEEKPAEVQEPAEAQKPPEDQTPAPKENIVTPVKPFKINDVIAEKIQEMEDMEEEMHQEVEKRRDHLQRKP